MTVTVFILLLKCSLHSGNGSALNKRILLVQLMFLEKVWVGINATPLLK